MYDEGDISTPFLPLSVDFFLFKYLSVWLYLLYLRLHVDVEMSLALPYGKPCKGVYSFLQQIAQSRSSQRSPSPRVHSSTRRDKQCRQGRHNI